MRLYDFAGHTTLPHGPHEALGRGLESPAVDSPGPLYRVITKRVKFYAKSSHARGCVIKNC